ncbi:hypothetical protein LTR72_001676 [Exophiala xenobiotica]|nr:hypothetical protein LTR72_001676 [Exophiala xenobiotica]KAK5296107.1 hypothetical protein LTR14_003738 [Exophiala xenobiotica]KAK5492521.1 hypothetical protein LTR55_003876 [Exophiala xenobiotica]
MFCLGMMRTVCAERHVQAMSYLTFLADHYDNLPLTMVLLHPHLEGWLRAWHTDSDDYNNVNSIRSLSIENLQCERYFNMRCIHDPGCPAEIQVCREPREEHRTTEHAMLDAWNMFGGIRSDVPPVITEPCYSQFAVTKSQVLQRPKSEYLRVRQWLLDTPLDDDTSGRVMEYRWHAILGRGAVSCPPLNQCRTQPPSSSTWLLATQRRDNSTSTSTATRRPSPSPSHNLLDQTTPNPVTTHYLPSPSYPSISLKPYPSNVQASINRDLSSNRPPPLETPPPLERTDYDDGQIPLGDQAKRLFRVGKAYLTFYKTGFKSIWSNYKDLRAIHARLGTRKLENIIKYGSSSAADTTNTDDHQGEEKGNETETRKSEGHVKHHVTPQPQAQAQPGDDKTVHGPSTTPTVTRRDYQLALRTRHDLYKLVPFSLVFAICGEFTPLVILAIGSAAVPYPCRIPAQEQQDFQRPVKIQPRVDEAAKRISESNSNSDSNTTEQEVEWKREFIDAHRLHLSPFLTPIPVIGPLWHRLYSGPRLRRHCDEVLCDTILIRREGGFDKLPPREVFQWSLKYGLRTLTEYMDDLKRQGKPLDPDSAELKKVLLPVVEAEADYILNVDWRRLKPEDQWRAVYRPPGPAKVATPDDRHLTSR